jgi:hypothetical protein
MWAQLSVSRLEKGSYGSHLSICRRRDFIVRIDNGGLKWRAVRCRTAGFSDEDSQFSRDASIWGPLIRDFLDSLSPTTIVGLSGDSTAEPGSGKHCS